MAGETKEGTMSPILPFGSCACRERFSRQLLGFILERELIGLLKVNRWDVVFKLAPRLSVSYSALSAY